MREDWENKPLVIEIVEGCEPEIGRLVWQLEVTRQRLVERLDDVTQAQLDFQPHNGNGIGTLLYHIAAIEMDWLYEEVLEATPFPAEVAKLLALPVRNGEGRLTMVNGRSLQVHLHTLNRTRQYLIETCQQMELADFRRVRHFENYSCTPEWVLHHLIQHEAEHRGEILTVKTLAS